MADITFTADDAVVSRLFALADAEGRSSEELLDEALRSYLEAYHSSDDVQQHLDASVREHGELYRRLAE